MPVSDFFHWFFLFQFYSFLGWCCEMVYCSLRQRRLCEKRGFLNSPICPIYGHGALLVLWALKGGCRDPLLTFFFGALLTSAVEYLTSFIMEKLFHMRWWDYSDYRFNLNGRVCLLNSTLFGLACVALCHLIHPRVEALVRTLSGLGIAFPLAVILLIGYAADIVLSVRSAIQMGERLKKLQAIHSELQQKLEELKREQLTRLEQNLAGKREELKERRDESLRRFREKLETLEEQGEELSLRWKQAKTDAQERTWSLLDGPDFFERRLLRSHPRLRAKDRAEALQKLREHLKK